jgi:hypothetical protein
LNHFKEWGSLSLSMDPFSPKGQEKPAQLHPHIILEILEEPSPKTYLLALLIK